MALRHIPGLFRRKAAWIVLVLSLPGGLRGQTPYYWYPSSGLWTNPTQWVPTGVPGNADSANFTSGGTATISSALSVGSLLLTSGTITGSGSLTLVSAPNNSDWNGGGSLAGLASLVVSSGVTLAIDGGADHNANGLGLTIQGGGIVNYTAGWYRGGNSAAVNNYGTWNDSNTATVDNLYGGTSLVFYNEAGGTYNKTTGTTQFNVPFVNAGSVVASGGTFQLNLGGTLAAGSTTGSSGSGVAELAGGTLTATGSMTLTNFLLAAGQLGGTPNFVNSVVNWTATTFDAGTTITIASTSTLNIMSVDHDYSSDAIVNNGIVNWTGGWLRGGNGGSITNNHTWNDSTSSTADNNYGGTVTYFTNAASGTYNKTAGTTTFNVPFVNAGTVAVSGGTLQFNGGGTLSGGSVTGSSGSGLVELTSGTLTANGSDTLTNFVFAGGQLAGNPTFVNSVYSWTGSTTWDAGTTITNGSTSTLNITVSDHDFNNDAIVNAGTVNWSAGWLRGGNGATITNNGSWNDTNTATLDNYYGGTAAVFTNGSSGTYNKTAGTTIFNIPFNNNGAVAVTGTAVFDINAGATFGSGSSTSATTNATMEITGGTLTSTGPVTLSNFLFAGGHLGTINFVNSTVNWNGGGAWDTGATVTIGSGTTLSLTTADHDFNNEAIVNNATVNWSAGWLRGGNASTFTNNGTWNDTASATLDNLYGGATDSFINAAAGQYNKTAGTTTFNSPFINYGTVLATTAGVFDLNAGGTLETGSHTGSSGTGVAELTGGVLTPLGSVVLTNFLFAGGQLGGSPTFNTSTLTWNGGGLWNTGGTVTIGTASTLTLNGSDHGFDTETIVNNGTTNWSGTGWLRGGDSASITNNATWVDSATATFDNLYGGATDSFNNAANGVYQKVSGVTTFNSPFYNHGTVTVTGGSFSINAGGELFANSLISASGGGVAQLTGGVLLGTGTETLTGFNFAGGELDGIETLLGSFSWTGGDWNTGGTTTIGASGVLALSGSDHLYNSHTIINNGVVTWTAGWLRSGNGGSITNNGTWSDSASATVDNLYGGTVATFANAGTYAKTSNATTFNVPFTNSGVIAVASGSALTFSSTFTTTAGSLALSGGTLNFGSALSLGPTSLVGNGTVNAPSISSAGVVAPAVSSVPGILTINSSLSLLSSSNSIFTLGGTTAGTQYDQLAVSGALSLGGTLTLSFINGFQNTVNASETFTLISSTALSGSFSDVASGGRLTTVGGYGSFLVTYSPGTNLVQLSNFSPVPEPATWALMAGGVGAMAAFANRRRRRPE